jgi:hypothetical protein
VIDDDRSWTAFASNVGKARILRHDAVEIRLRWVGAILLLLVVAAAGFSPCATTASAPAGGPPCCPWIRPVPRRACTLPKLNPFNGRSFN